MKKIVAMILAILMLGSVAMLAGCGSSEADYKVTVVDALGNPYADVIVRFMQNGVQSAMEVTKADGVAVKTMAKGKYTVELQFTSSDVEYYYDTAEMELTSGKTELTVVMAQKITGEPRKLTGYSLKEQDNIEHEAYEVASGCTYVELVSGERNYFLFTPVQAGTYTFTVLESDAQIGYYGATHFVQQHSAVDVIDNVITISISEGMIGDGGGAEMVFGLDGAEKVSGILAINRIGEPTKTISDEPWTVYETSHTPEPFTLQLPAGKKLSYVDITKETADYTVVLGNDGFYHLDSADGPVLYINLGKDAPYVSLQKVIRGDGPMGGAPIRNYFYDDAGNFQKKEDYTDILNSYFDCLDQTYGVYPLTEDLAYILKHGCDGWWTVSSPDFIMEGCNPELGWLFACCYVK